MKSIELSRINNVSVVAILRDDFKFHEFVVCFDFDAKKPFGEQWNNGSYTTSFLKASEYFRAFNSYHTYSRMEEIATTALHVLEDYELLEDADNDIVLDEDEFEFFGLSYPYDEV